MMNTMNMTTAMTKIEFYLSPDGSVMVKPDGEAMFIYTQDITEVREALMSILRDLYPEALGALSRLYEKSARNKAYFEYLITHRFIRCNFGEYDALSFDIDSRGLPNFEEVRCPLRGECKNEGIICKPKLQTALSPREREVAILLAEGVSKQEIADELNISAFTVTRHISNIKSRWGVRTTGQIISRAQILRDNR